MQFYSQIWSKAEIIPKFRSFQKNCKCLHSVTPYTAITDGVKLAEPTVVGKVTGIECHLRGAAWSQLQYVASFVVVAGPLAGQRGGCYMSTERSVRRVC